MHARCWARARGCSPGLIYGTSKRSVAGVFAPGWRGAATGVLWLRAWIASMLSRIVDTVLFISISFYGLGLPLGTLMTGQIISKLTLSTIMVPR
jgi:hypothetical protein